MLHFFAAQQSTTAALPPQIAPQMGCICLRSMELLYAVMLSPLQLAFCPKTFFIFSFPATWFSITSGSALLARKKKNTTTINLLCNRLGHGNACIGDLRTQTRDMDTEFAAGFLFIFYFWLHNGKNYKMYFSSQKELENL